MKLRIALMALLFAVAAVSSASAKDARKLDEIAGTYEEGDLNTAFAELKAYTKLHADDDLAWTIFGHVCMDLGKIHEAEAAYKKAVQLNPKRVEALTGLGVYARTTKKYADAMRWYKMAVQINPNYAQAYSSMVVIAIKGNQFKTAVEVGEKGYKLDSEDPVIAANLAIAYHYNNQMAARDKMAKIAITLGYKKPEALQGIFSGKLDVRD